MEDVDFGALIRFEGCEANLIENKRKEDCGPIGLPGVVLHIEWGRSVPQVPGMRVTGD